MDWIKNITRTDHMGTPQRAGNTPVGHICSVRRLFGPVHHWYSHSVESPRCLHMRVKFIRLHVYICYGLD